MTTQALYDVVIVGGGPAGLNAALVLARCRRRLLVCDAGQPRNAAARALHGYLGHDGVSPRELRRLGRTELKRYGVDYLNTTVASGRCVADAADAARFELQTTDHLILRARRVLLATGVTDALPDIPGVRAYYGRGVHHCPYCDGWEYRDAPLAAYGRGRPAVGLALALRTWSDRVTVCTDGHRLAAPQRARLTALDFALREEPIVRLEGIGTRRAPGDSDGARGLRRIVFERGPDLTCSAMFFNTPQGQRSALAAMLGCGADRRGQFETHGRQRTRVPGLYLAGDADGDVQFAVVAAAEGATAAVAINRELQEEEAAARAGARA